MSSNETSPPPAGEPRRVCQAPHPIRGFCTLTVNEQLFHEGWHMTREGDRWPQERPTSWLGHQSDPFSDPDDSLEDVVERVIPLIPVIGVPLEAIAEQLQKALDRRRSHHRRVTELLADNRKQVIMPVEPDPVTALAQAVLENRVRLIKDGDVLLFNVSP